MHCDLLLHVYRNRCPSAGISLWMNTACGWEQQMNSFLVIFSSPEVYSKAVVLLESFWSVSFSWQFDFPAPYMAFMILWYRSPCSLILLTFADFFFLIIILFFYLSVWKFHVTKPLLSRFDCCYFAQSHCSYSCRHWSLFHCLIRAPDGT